MGSTIYDNYTAAVGNGISKQVGSIDRYRLIVTTMNHKHWAGNLSGAGLHIVA